MCSFVQVKHSDWIMQLQDKKYSTYIKTKYEHLFTGKVLTHEYVLLSMRKWKIHLSWIYKK